MSKNLQTPTKLTEFAPLNQEEKPQTVGQIFSKFFGFGKTEGTSSNPTHSTHVTSYSTPEEASSASNWTVVSPKDIPEGSEPTSYVLNVDEGRSLPNVVKRISNLLARTDPTLQDYSDTDLKQYWMPDSVSKECYECGEKFTTFRRKHHCRVCGQIFCSQCCSYHIPGKILRCTGDLRVCTYCCKIILAYLQSSNVTDDLPSDLKQLLDSLQSKFGESSGGLSLLSPTQSGGLSKTESSESLRRKISVGYQEERFGSGSSVSYLSSEEKCKALQQSVSLRNLFEEICKPVTGVQFENYKYRLRMYSECCLGSELVDWLIRQQKAKTRVQASALCQALLEAGYFESVSEPVQNNFQDGNVRYKKGKILSPLSPNLSHSSPTFEVISQEEPSWVRQIPHETSSTDSDMEQVAPLLQGFPSSESYMLDLNLEANTVYISRPSDLNYSTVQSPESPILEHCSHETTVIRPSEQMEVAPESGWFNAKDLREENGEKEAYNRLSEAYELHEQSLVKQLLSAKGLSSDWTEILLNLMHDIVAVIRPDKNHDAIDLDIRNYVQFKKLPGGSKMDTQLVNGVVCTKNVAHKEMSTDIENPKILLLQCPIMYQRTEGRLMSLEPVLMQESEYLRHVCTRISSFEPDVVLVQRNVSRLAQDMLRNNKITLVYNVKQTVLDRVARCTNADIVTAVDAHIGRPNLGTCKRFCLKSFNTERGGQKILMFFEGLSSPWLGSTVLLRGGTRSELARLKIISSLLLFTAYNWRLEKSFLMDEFAMPPNSKCEFLDDSKENSPDFNTPEKNFVITDISRENEGKGKIAFNFENEEEKLVAIIHELKTENNKRIVTESIKDFTDPLHSTNYETTKENISEQSKPNLTVTELYFNSFRKNLDGTILCSSPYIIFSVPYLETDSGKKSKLSRFFPKNMYYSEQFEGNNKKVKNNLDSQKSVDEADAKKNNQPLHPFLTAKITNIDDVSIQNLLAHFRACGGQYEKKEMLSVVSVNDQKSDNLELNFCQKDCLDPSNHQRLAVLFCSFSHESQNAPAFCVNPWVVHMEFYGKNDIPLGCFLERYCFRPTYDCPSKSCYTPMVKHVRRFVHNNGCVSIIVNNCDNETFISEEDIAMWTWCTKCQCVSPVVPMSSDTWSYSFAKYLELKFHGDAFSRRGLSPCQHSLHHDHYQYFGFKNYVAFFKYTPISTWEISLPPLLIDLDYSVGNYHEILIDNIKTLSQKIHEMFGAISEKICAVSPEEADFSSLKQLLSQRQTIFKQKLEDVQVKAVSPTIKNKEFDPKQSYFAHQKIFDNLTRLKFSLVETIDFWNSKLGETLKKRDSEKKKEKTVVADQESPGLDVGEVRDLSIESMLSDVIQNVEANVEENQTESDFPPPDHSLESHSEDKVEGKPNNNKETDKKNEKSVMNILDKLLTPAPNANSIQNPFLTQEHYTLPTSVSIPIVVYETEPSSIIAYALNSFDYKKAFEDLTIPQGTKKSSSIGGDQTPSPVTKRKSTNSDKEKLDSEDKGSSLFQFLRSRDSKTDLLHSPTGGAPALEIEFEPSTTPEKTLDDPKKTRNSHIEIQFQDSTCKFYCTVYLADKFAQLRASFLPMGEDEYIRSLCRSVPWKVRGGKSGSNFSKTADGRFVLKEMSKNEVQLFLEFASNYFIYMDNCFTTKQPTLLAKIVGIYQITLKNNSNFTLKTDLLVMENLFYNREVEQKFDLKGSMRNRLTVPDNQDGEIVFLDENLLKMTCDNPLYILPHSKEVLMAAIHNDTEFLSTHSVMDYSLVVGLDTNNKELVLGIIDYIRTFTWDKRLENIIKKIGSQGKMPTIVSPQEYRKRFIEAMHKYFLEVPDHWADLGKGLEF